MWTWTHICSAAREVAVAAAKEMKARKQEAMTAADFTTPEVQAAFAEMPDDLEVLGVFFVCRFRMPRSP
jgi:hypothetical protein